MDYFSRKPDFPTFEDIYIARAQGAIELERRGDEVACRFGRVATSLGISNEVERARRRLATEISSGSISAAGVPKRNLGVS